MTRNRPARELAERSALGWVLQAAAVQHDQEQASEGGGFVVSVRAGFVVSTWVGPAGSGCTV
jgi:hypothetical protein